MSKFYVIATPIGNLEDITVRAVRILSEVDFVLCEDTRVTQKLLNYLGLNKKTISFHKFSKDNAYRNIFDLLKEGKDLALVSDAGTPAISDPGAFLIKKIRENIKDINIVAVPGPSAVTAVLSVAGLDSDQFVFLGFPPHKKGRKNFFKNILNHNMPVVIYESKHRILKTLEALEEILPVRELFLAKEVTKMNEKYFSGKPSEIKDILSTDTHLLKGEFVLVIK